MEAVIVGALVVLIFLVLGLIAIVLFNGRKDGAPTELKASLSEQFLNFQTNIHEALNTATRGIEGAKDTLADRAIQSSNQIKDMEKTIQSLIQQQQEAQTLGQSLKDLLQAPKLRGNYGEAILEELLERVLPKGIWERQYSIDSGVQVDCVVRFKDVVIPIDAKFPRDDYMRYLEAESPNDKATRWKEFENAVRVQIASIQTKYVKPERGTSEFALMFIPSEAIYYETIAENNHLGQPSTIQDYAQDHNVLPVSPNTFYAFLQMVVLGVRNAEVIKSAKKLQEGLTNLQKSFGYFYKKYEDIGKGIERASDAYRVGEGHIDRYKTRLDATLQLEGLQVEQSPELPQKLAHEDNTGETS